MNTSNVSDVNITKTNISVDIILYLGEKHVNTVQLIVLNVVYITIFLSGIVGNTCTCIVIARNRHMHTATNYYLISLAIGDLLTLLIGKYT